MDNFAKAKKLADAASCFDHLKHIYAGKNRAEAIEHVAFMHDLATELAGDRADEIYPPEEHESGYRMRDSDKAIAKLENPAGVYSD